MDIKLCNYIFVYCNKIIQNIKIFYNWNVIYDNKVKDTWPSWLHVVWCSKIREFRVYRSGTVNSNTVNSKFHLIRSYCEIFFYNFPNIPCLKYTVNSNFHLIRSKTLPTNAFELTVPDLYLYARGLLGTIGTTPIQVRRYWENDTHTKGGLQTSRVLRKLLAPQEFISRRN